MRITLAKLIVILSLITGLILLSGCGKDDADVYDESQNETESSSVQIDEPQEQESEELLKYDNSSFMSEVPDWEGYAFCYINNNRPDFDEDEIWDATQESLDPLDDLGRCGTADSCIGQDGMPDEPRGDISSIEPTGLQKDKYVFIEGELLYNRCHLIGHQLSGDDAVSRNIICGTSYMNREGMLPFENAIAEYVKSTGNHVMYRVTPVFVGDEMVARGVHMQAVSVEDEGEGLAFNVFCYNVQPGVDIDYLTGDNSLSEDNTMLEDYQAGKFALIANTLGVIPSETESGDVSGSADNEEAASEETQDQDGHTMTYILNTNTGKFHYPDCKSVGDMKEKNKQEVEATREEIINRGFSPCGNCNP